MSNGSFTVENRHCELIYTPRVIHLNLHTFCTFFLFPVFFEDNRNGFHAWDYDVFSIHLKDNFQFENHASTP